MQQDLRCFCSRRPLLAKCGRDERGEPFIWVKVFKQGRIYGEVVATSGTVKLRCRECLRWHQVKIVRVHNDQLSEIDFRPEVEMDSGWQRAVERLGA